MGLSFGQVFDKLAAASELQVLADWQEGNEKFSQNIIIREIFGSYFLGLDTDFEIFQNLSNFYRAIEDKFVGVEKLEIKQLLKNRNFELLSAIPKHLKIEFDGNYDDLLSHILNMTEYKKSSKVDFERIKELIPGFIILKTLELVELKNIRTYIISLSNKNLELSENEQIIKLLRENYSGSETVDNNIDLELSIAESVLRIDEENKKAIVTIIRDNNLEEFRATLKQYLSNTKDAEISLQNLLFLTGQNKGHFDGKGGDFSIPDFLAEGIKNSGELYKQSAFASARSFFKLVAHPELTDLLIEHGISLTQLPDISKALIARSFMKCVYRDYGPILGRFQGLMLDDLREKLANADRKVIESTRKLLRKNIKRSANPPPGVRRGKKSELTEYALLENEINKKARFVPVRALTERAGRALQELKPCWMMSPLAVAHYIPQGTIEFDLCIIDEASQMPPEDSLGAIARSKQTVVVGDTNQLPPTSFFRKTIDEEDEDEDVTTLEESILELANNAFRPKRRLQWHYRSRHSSLINFSNKLIYDDELIVFPSNDEERKDMGVSFVKVDGTYKSGINATEADAIIKAALEFMEQSPNRSLGIVTLNQKQRDLISDGLEYELRNRSKARKYIDVWNEKNNGLESFFIKNLENVQGDERDVIFIGTVYGPELPGGPVMQRFGPINGLAGRRRLNVLFTRAKLQIKTFSSMNAADIRADETGNPGTYLLKRWLEFSVTGVIEGGQLTGKEPDSDFEVFVIDQINSMGCEAIPQVGVSGYFIDIGVKHPSWPHGYILGVECDGASYHSSKSARDRDRNRQEVLEGLGWRFHRIWSTDWFNEPQKEIEKLRNVITKRVHQNNKNTINKTPVIPEIMLSDSAIIQKEEKTFVSDNLELQLEGTSLKRDVADKFTYGQWSEEKEKQLINLFNDGWGIRKISSFLGIRRNEIELKLSNQGLIDSHQFFEDEYPREPSHDDPKVILNEGKNFQFGAGPGDKVKIRYLGEQGKILTIFLDEKKNIPDQNIVSVSSPLGAAILGVEPQEEVMFLVDNRLNKILIEEIERTAESKQSQEEDTKTDEESRVRLNQHDAESTVKKISERIISATDILQDDLDERDGPVFKQYPTVDPNRFYDEEYQFKVRNLGLGLIDRVGPITHRHLSKKIARLHGFKRTGKKIRQIVSRSISNSRTFERDPEGERIYWPENCQPEKIISFRGIEIEGDRRYFDEIPYPEKLGLAYEAVLDCVGRSETRDPIDYIVRKLELSRLTETTREQIEKLIVEANNL
jgi:superfamily I DNA and/or RNA helicase